jgi:hypothetical protein
MWRVCLGKWRKRSLRRHNGKQALQPVEDEVNTNINISPELLFRTRVDFHVSLHFTEAFTFHHLHRNINSRLQRLIVSKIVAISISFVISAITELLR